MVIQDLQVGNIRIVLGDTNLIGTFHAVVSVLFLNMKLVMVRHVERGWEFPGGRRQGNETIQETIVREVMEETGANLSVVKVVGYYQNPAGEITVIATAEVLDFETSPADRQNVEVGIFERLPDNLSFSDGREEIILDYARHPRSSDKLSSNSSTQ